MWRKLVLLTSLCAVLLFTGNVSAELMGHWKLDEGSGTTAADSSGKGNHATIVGTPKWVTGVSGLALEFDGDDRVDCGKDPSLDITAPMTMMIWARSNVMGETHTTNPGVFAKADQASGWSWQLRYKAVGTPGYMGFQFNPQGGGTRVWVSVGQNLEVGEWYHITGVADGTNAICYLNGQEKDKKPLVNFVKSTGNLYIGYEGWVPWEGAADDARVYNHALSEPEILGAMAGKPWVYASAPSPKDGALNPSTWAEIKWRPSPVAVSHDVYLGENFDDVNSGAAQTFRGNQALTSLFVGLGLPGDPYPGGLVPGTTYYWRIDEVNTADPNSPWKGPIWSFSIPPKTAYNPVPADGAEFVALNTKLTWTTGFGAKLHTIYLGGSFDDVNNATSGGAMVGTTTYSPASLKSEQVYYWRVDESDPPNTYKGQVWSFTTPGAVGKPHPSNDADDAEMNAILTWTPSASAASHQVYFGTDKEAVRKAGTTSPEYKGVRALGAETYDPGLLAWDSTYYWRVDEVNNVNANSPWKGPLWSFTAGQYLLVEDFESYNDIDAPAAGSNRIFDKWVDGFATPTTNGAVVGNNLPPYAERTVIHGGAQSMPYSYDTNLKSSEATLTLTAGRDWTAQGVTSLSLWFRGASTNAAERMYVALANRTGAPAAAYHGEVNATKMAGWANWVIPLQTFADLGVNLADVDRIVIGFGTKGNTTTTGGTGKMYFDDVRLYRPTTP
jgi:hypothetical protein